MKTFNYTILGLLFLLIIITSLLSLNVLSCSYNSIKWYFIKKYIICYEKNIQGFYIDKLWLYHYISDEITPGKQRRFEEKTGMKSYLLDNSNDFLIELREKVEIVVVLPYVIHKAVEDVYCDFYKSAYDNTSDNSSECNLWFKNLGELLNYRKSVELCDLIIDYLMENFYLNSTIIQYRKENTPFYLLLNSNGYVVKEMLKFMRKVNRELNLNNYSHYFNFGNKYKTRNFCMVNANSQIDEYLRVIPTYEKLKDNDWEKFYNVFSIGNSGKFIIIRRYYYFLDKTFI